MTHNLMGLSGGADSVYLLLHLLEQGGRVTAVHVNHGLRGDESDGDEAFVRRLCAQKGVPLLVYHAAPPDNPSEDWARQVRYGFFREAMRETGAQALVLAHHRDDQAETVLMHLLRGSGLKGLGGMSADAAVDGLRILRPLLGMSRAEIRAELEKRGQDWREDRSNSDTKYLRNAIRQDILPRLEALIPGAGRRIAQTANLLREDEAALNALAQQALDGLMKAWLPLKALAGKTAAVRSRMLRLWVRQVAKQSLNEEQTRAVTELSEAPAGTKITLPGGIECYRGWTHLHLLLRYQPIPPHGFVYAHERFTGDHGDGVRSQSMPVQLAKQCELRMRQPGDFIQPFGSRGRQSLQDYLVNRHVDAPFRDWLPLWCIGQEVILVSGVGASEKVRGLPEEERVLIRIEGEMPWAKEDNGGQNDDGTEFGDLSGPEEHSGTAG